MRFVSLISICQVLMTSYSFSIPIEESQQITSSSQSSSVSSSSSSSSYLSNMFDFSGLADRFKSWSRNENQQSSQSTSESMQMEQNEKSESYSQSSSQLESQMGSAQSAASANVGEQGITAPQTAVAAETSKKKRIKSTQSQNENTCQTADAESTSIKMAETESIDANLQVADSAMAATGAGGDTVAVSESTSTSGRRRKKVVQNQAEDSPQIKDAETEALSQVNEAENTGIFESISQSVSSLMSSTQSQTTSATEDTVQKGNVAVDESAITAETRAKDGGEKTNSASDTGISAIRQASESENANILELLSQKVSNAMGTSAPDSAQTQMTQGIQEAEIAAVESNSTAETSAVSKKKKKSKSSQVQADCTSQVTDASSTIVGETSTNDAKQENALITAQANSVSMGSDVDVVSENGVQTDSDIVSAKKASETILKAKSASKSTQNGIDQSASQIQSESASEMESATQVRSSSQTESESKSFLSSLVSNASNAVLGSETSSNGAASVCESNLNAESQSESSVVQSIAETITTVTSSILSSSTTEESSTVESESNSCKDADGAQALSVAKSSTRN